MQLLSLSHLRYSSYVGTNVNPMKKAWIDRDTLNLLIDIKGEGRSYRALSEEIEGVAVTTLHRVMNGGYMSLDTLLALLGWLECDITSVVRPPVRQMTLF